MTCSASESRNFCFGKKLNRRAFLKWGAGFSSLSLAARFAHGAGPYQVGLGRDADPYNATLRAVESSEEWATLQLQGRTVIVKPNLVLPGPPESGMVTDAEVTRALVDLALSDGAERVLIVETSPFGAFFSETGYDFFSTYHPAVELLDLNDLPQVLIPVPFHSGLAYWAIHVPDLILDPESVLISAAKLKTHDQSLATLSMKNLFGLPAVDLYQAEPPLWRFAMHERGVNQTIVDLNYLRPVDFAVIDGIWGMEGDGPVEGTPVRMDTVIAGTNAVAVDRVALAVMEIGQTAVQHLTYASQGGLGPTDLGQILVKGDPLVTYPFQLPTVPPVVDYPRVSPSSFNPASGGQAEIVLRYRESAIRTVDVLRLSESTPEVEVIRLLQIRSSHPAGFERLTWDGRGDDGSLVPPGRYAVHVKTERQGPEVRTGNSVGWVFVV